MGSFADLIERSKIVILDGAMGTELQTRGCDVTLPLWSARALVTRPDVVRHIHIDNIDCGAEIITTNSFRTQRRTLEKANYSLDRKSFAESARELTSAAVDLAKDAVMIAADENQVLVAGCIAPLEDSYRPDLVPGEASLAAEHYDHIKNLVDGGADMLIAETLTTITEIRAVLEQLRKFELDYAISVTPKNETELLSGEPLTNAINVIHQYKPTAIMINCMHPSLGEPVLLHLRQLTDKPLGVYANVGNPDFQEGDELRTSILPSDYLDYARKWKLAGAKIIGGCCGTTPLYIRKLNVLKKEK